MDIDRIHPLNEPGMIVVLIGRDGVDLTTATPASRRWGRCVARACIVHLTTLTDGVA